MFFNFIRVLPGSLPGNKWHPVHRWPTGLNLKFGRHRLGSNVYTCLYHLEHALMRRESPLGLHICTSDFAMLMLSDSHKSYFELEILTQRFQNWKHPPTRTQLACVTFFSGAPFKLVSFGQKISAKVSKKPLPIFFRLVVLSNCLIYLVTGPMFATPVKSSWDMSLARCKV